MKKGEARFTVADSILPLLDITLLLLGLFIILFAVSTAQKSQAAAESAASASAVKSQLPGQVIIIKIKDAKTVEAVTQSGTQAVQVHQLKDFITKTGHKVKNGIYLLQISNSWDKNLDKIYKQCIKDFKEMNVKYSRVFP